MLGLEFKILRCLRLAGYLSSFSIREGAGIFSKFEFVYCNGKSVSRSGGSMSDPGGEALKVCNRLIEIISSGLMYLTVQSAPKLEKL